MSSPMEKAYAKYQAANLAAQKVAVQTGQTQELKTDKDQLGNTTVSYAPSTPNPVVSAPSNVDNIGRRIDRSPVESSPIPPQIVSSPTVDIAIQPQKAESSKYEGPNNPNKTQTSILGLTISGSPRPGTAEYYREQFGLSGNKSIRGKNGAAATRDLIVVTPAKIPNYDPFVRDEKGNAVGTFDSAGNITGVQIKPGFKGQVVKGEEEGEFYYKATPEEQELYYPKERSYALTPSQETNLKYEAVQNISKRGGSLTQDAINQEVGNLLDTKYAVKTPTGETGFAITGGSTISPKDMGTLYAGFKADQIAAAGNAGEVSGYALSKDDQQTLRNNIAGQVKRGEISKEEGNRQIANIKNIANSNSEVTRVRAENKRIDEENRNAQKAYTDEINAKDEQMRELGYGGKIISIDDKGVRTDYYKPIPGATQYELKVTDETNPFKLEKVAVSKPEQDQKERGLPEPGTPGTEFGAGIIDVAKGYKAMATGEQAPYNVVGEAQSAVFRESEFARSKGVIGFDINFEAFPKIFGEVQKNPERAAGQVFGEVGAGILFGEGAGKAASGLSKVGGRIAETVRGTTQRAFAETEEAAAASKPTEAPTALKPTEPIELVGESGGARRVSSFKDLLSKQTLSDVSDSLSLKNVKLGARAVKTKFTSGGVSTEVASEEPTTFRTTSVSDEVSPTEPTTTEPTPTRSGSTSTSSGTTEVPKPSVTPTIQPAPTEGITPPEEFLGKRFTPPEELPPGFRPTEAERLRIAKEAKEIRSNKMKAQEQLDLVHNLLQQGKNSVQKAKTSVGIGRARASLLGESAVGKMQTGTEGIQTRTQALLERQKVLTGLRDIAKPKSPFKQEAAGSPSGLMGGKIPKVNKPRPINEDRFTRENIDREIGKDYGYSKGSIIQVQREVPKTTKYMNKVKARELRETEAKVSLLGENKEETKGASEGSQSKGVKRRKEFDSLLGVEATNVESFVSPPSFVGPSISGARESSRIVNTGVDRLIDITPRTRSSAGQPPKTPGAGNSGIERLSTPSKPRSSGSERLDITPRRGGREGSGTFTGTGVNIINIPKEGTGTQGKPKLDTNVTLDVGQGNIRIPTPKPPTPPSEKIKIPKLPPIPKLDLPGGGAFSSGSKGSGKSAVRTRAVRNIFLEGFDISTGEEGPSLKGGGRPKGKSKKDDLLSLF